MLQTKPPTGEMVKKMARWVKTSVYTCLASVFILLYGALHILRSREVSAIEKIGMEKGTSSLEDFTRDERVGSEGIQRGISEAETSGIHGVTLTEDFKKLCNISYVYSAYLDNRHDNFTFVRVTAMAKKNISIFCHVWFEETQLVATEAELHYYQYIHPAEYENVVISCQMEKTSHIPRWVALSDTKYGSEFTTLPVKNNKEMYPTSKFNFAVCLHKALINNYSNIRELVEWIEVNRILGAERFILFNYTGSEELLPFIQHYVKLGLVEYYPWSLYDIQHQMHDFAGQISLIDECIYRTMYRTKYLILTDLDEIIVPHMHENWRDLMAAESPCKGKPDIAVQNTFFPLDQPSTRYNFSSENSFILQDVHLNTLEKLMRRNHSMRCCVRSKVILEPDQVVYGSLHYVETLTNGQPGTRCCMPAHLALLHHYRNFSSTMQRVWELEYNKMGEYQPYWENFIQDTRMLHFAKAIEDKVGNVFKEVSNKPL